MRVLLCFTAAVLAATAVAAHAETISYTYDAQGRLLTVVTTAGPNNGETVTVVFDKEGNRVSYTVAGA